MTEHQDDSSGVRVRKLTNHKCHSWHLYFHNPGWWDEGRRLVFKSHRGNRIGSFSVELETGAISYIAPVNLDILNPHRPEGYANHGREIVAVDLHTGATRTLMEKPEGWDIGLLQITADGNHVAMFLNEKVDVGPVETMKDYVGFAESGPPIRSPGSCSCPSTAANPRRSSRSSPGSGMSSRPTPRTT
ncbi:MAG: hypothetical protein M5U09_18485 [Gammaproteobacteria bacterium]|nr:hypothetical protein [Gammaproteobacteria bacterium]